MKTIYQRLLKEPAAVAAAVLLVIQVVLLLPDWRAALASAAVTIAGGATVRAKVTPTRKVRGRIARGPR